MKMLVTLIGSLFALTAFAAEPAKKDEKKDAPGRCSFAKKDAPGAPAKKDEKKAAPGRCSFAKKAA